MASIVKLQIDSFAYDWSSRKWNELMGETPENIMAVLSSGNGFTTPIVKATVKEIDHLMERMNNFEPTVRLSGNEGRDIRKRMAAWYAHLHYLKMNISRKSKVSYLADLVNDKLRKPYVDEIARLRQTLIDGQQNDAGEVAKRIRFQRKLISELPVCTNDIITIYLHHQLDTLYSGDTLDLEKTIMEEKRLRENHDSLTAQISDKSIDAAKKEDLRNSLQRVDFYLSDVAKKMKGTLYKYYETLTPENIADYLTRYSGTFWNKINVKKNPIDVSFKIAARKKKASAVSVSKDASRKPIRKKKPVKSLGVRAEEMILYPFAVSGTDCKELYRSLTNDLNIICRFVIWAQSRNEKVMTPEYREQYEGFWRAMKTLPAKKEPLKKEEIHKDSVQSAPATVTYDDIIKYMLTQFYDNSKTVPVWIQEKQQIIEKFCQRPDAAELFEQWKPDFNCSEDDFKLSHNRARATIFIHRIEQSIQGQRP